MSDPLVQGGRRLTDLLSALGLRMAFGLPGTQNTEVFEAFRASGLRLVVPTSETAAAFMANGYARTTGRPALLAVIPGPGLLWSVPGLGEALLDSVPLVCITGMPAESGGRRFTLQNFDHEGVLGPLTKRVLRIETPDELEPLIELAWKTALAPEPGPVVVQLGPRALEPAPSPSNGRPSVLDGADLPHEPAQVQEVLRRLKSANRPVLLAGQGAVPAADELRSLAERFGCAVIATTSARGIVPEDHSLVIPVDGPSAPVSELNRFLEEADLVVALGMKFGHNSSFGFRLRIPSDKFVHVDGCSDVLGANYEADLLIRADVPGFLRDLERLLRGEPHEGIGKGWGESVLEDRRTSLAPAPASVSGRKVHHAGGLTVPDLIRTLQGVLPRDAILATDSGLHQMEFRSGFRVLAPRGLLVPTDMQSMGFALPAAIGAKLAAPDRQVVAVIGDGGIAMSGLELRTAAALHLPVKILVLNDGAFGLIRRQQMGEYGRAPGSSLPGLDLSALCRAVGVHYSSLGGLSPGESGAVERSAVQVAIEDWLAAPDPGVLEVFVGDSAGPVHHRARLTAIGVLRRSPIGSTLLRMRRWVRSIVGLVLAKLR